MTAHELARLLLSGPDYEVLLSLDDQFGMVSSLEDPETAEYQKAKRFDSGRLVDEGQGTPCVVLAPLDRSPDTEDFD